MLCIAHACGFAPVCPPLLVRARATANIGACVGAKALFRRGEAHRELGDERAARVDFTQALASARRGHLESQTEAIQAALDNLEQRPKNSADTAALDDFIAAPAFDGAKPLFIFKNGFRGLGYYRDGSEDPSTTGKPTSGNKAAAKGDKAALDELIGAADDGKPVQGWVERFQEMVANYCRRLKHHLYTSVLPQGIAIVLWMVLVTGLFWLLRDSISIGRTAELSAGRHFTAADAFDNLTSLGPLHLQSFWAPIASGPHMGSLGLVAGPLGKYALAVTNETLQLWMFKNEPTGGVVPLVPAVSRLFRLQPADAAGSTIAAVSVHAWDAGSDAGWCVQSLSHRRAHS